MIIISDTSPINYLVMIGMQDLLQKLFAKVIIPEAVYKELLREKTPEIVKSWLAACPDWLEVKAVRNELLPGLENLHRGEVEAINPASQLHADALLIDERDGRKEAAKLGLNTIGTLGILDKSAELGLISFSDAIEKLRETPFREPKELVAGLIRKHL